MADRLYNSDTIVYELRTFSLIDTRTKKNQALLKSNQISLLPTQTHTYKQYTFLESHQTDG